METKGPGWRWSICPFLGCTRPGTQERSLYRPWSSIVSSMTRVFVEFCFLKGGPHHFFSEHSGFIISDKILKGLLLPEGRTKRTGTSSAAALLFQPHGYVDFSNYTIRPVLVGGWGLSVRRRGRPGIEVFVVDFRPWSVEPGRVWCETDLPAVWEMHLRASGVCTHTLLSHQVSLWVGYFSFGTRHAKSNL